MSPVLQLSYAELAGEKVADLLLINDRDLSYAKLRFDERSIATLKTHLGKLDDALARSLCLGFNLGYAS